MRDLHWVASCSDGDCGVVFRCKSRCFRATLTVVRSTLASAPLSGLWWLLVTEGFRCSGGGLVCYFRY
ncbi:hypothetical protein A2U01_0037523, partial [Trifolium medium]|nr:hypothetical protein [Trifolium medium]